MIAKSEALGGARGTFRESDDFNPIETADDPQTRLPEYPATFIPAEPPVAVEHAEVQEEASSTV